MNKKNDYYYVDTGAGALPRTHPSYVERSADRELREGIDSASKDTFRVFFILAPRQTGKSSLMRKTAYVLSDRNICVEISLHRSGGSNSEMLLYRTLLNRICKDIDLQLPELNYKKKFKHFWDRSDSQDDPREQFITFLEQILVPSLPKRLVVFIDEIQELVSNGLQNGFTALMKSISENDRLDNLAIVLLGVAQPEDLSTDTNLILNTAKLIELSSFDEKDCTPLLPGLREISSNPEEILSYILKWTGGHPFLTQVVCNKAVKSLKDTQNIGKVSIDYIVEEEIIQVWREKDPQYHFSLIDRWFTRIPPNPKEREKRWQTLLEYKKILTTTKPVQLNAVKKPEQMNFRLELMSLGIIRKVRHCLEVANLIYRKIFSSDWIDETTQTFPEDDMSEDYSDKIYGRSVTILIDASASMNDEDPETEDMKRLTYIKETIKGDALLILNHVDDKSGNKICDLITGYFFNVPRLKEPFYVYAKSPKRDVEIAFEGIKPQGGTAIYKTLKAVIDKCLEEKEKDNRDAFVIIYTDGQISNQTKFKELIVSTCEKLETQDAIKIIILGYGQEILDKEILEFYLDLDFDSNSHPNQNGDPCNILLFELGNEHPEDDILGLLDRQLRVDPNNKNVVPEWVDDRIPEWKEKAKRKGWLT